VGFVLLLLLDAVGSLGEITYVDRTSSGSPGRCMHVVVDSCGLFHVEYSPFRLSTLPMSIFFASSMVVADDGTGSDDGVVAGTADQYGVGQLGAIWVGCGGGGGGGR
jgi:hypothetical protein